MNYIKFSDYSEETNLIRDQIKKFLMEFSENYRETSSVDDEEFIELKGIFDFREDLPQYPYWCCDSKWLLIL